MYLQVALNVPFRRTFEYECKNDAELARGAAGRRVLVDFNGRQAVGVVTGSAAAPTYRGRIKEIVRLLDREPVFDACVMRLLAWAADYYHYPVGEVLYTALPAALKKPREDPLKPVDLWTAAPAAAEPGAAEKELGRAKACLRALEMIRKSPGTTLQLKEAGVGAAAIRKLHEKGLIEKSNLRDRFREWTALKLEVTGEKILNEEQADAFRAVAASEGYRAFVLNGVTGSGKTEVYLRLIAECLKKGRQALVLVPEINLTPQTVARFYERFNVPIVCMHSSMSDGERYESFMMMRRNEAAVLIGTRSAIFACAPGLGIIIVDEEHDGSYRQADGFRYHARDCAVMLALFRGIPIVMGTATPSMETLWNIRKGKYAEIRLSRRAGNAAGAVFGVIDMRRQPVSHGVSRELALRVNEELAKGNQALLLLNRRGYSNKLLCHGCGYVFMCRNCDASLTYHASEGKLVCHHCETRYPFPDRCPVCGSPELALTGNGTEQIMEYVGEIFPSARPVRVDRDSTARKGSVNALLEDIRTGKYNVIVGTQMLAKGHHFPGVTLVGIVDIDSYLYSNYFRAEEQMAQLVTQVAGRSGRGERQGYVYLQTHAPRHPALQCLVGGGYEAFAEKCLRERYELALPPVTCQAMLKADGASRDRTIDFITRAHDLLAGAGARRPGVKIFSPCSAYITRKQNRYGYHILVSAATRGELSDFADAIVSGVEELAGKLGVHAVLEIDPADAD